jgi:hypothetical protein
MADHDPKYPRQRSKGVFETDTQRNQKVLRRTPPSGYPVEIDPENTPPPQPAPTADLLQTMPLEQQVLALAQVQASHMAAIEHEQRIRHEGEELGRVKAQIEAISAISHDAVRTSTIVTETIMPLMRNLTDEVKALNSAQSMNTARREEFVNEWGRLQQSLGGLVLRLQNVEKLASAIEGIQRALDDHVRTTASRFQAIEARVTTIEQHRTTANAVTKALSRRDKAKRAGGIAGLAGLGATLWGAIHWLLEHAAK